MTRTRKPPYQMYDDIDHRIILELHANARASASDIARRLNANERTIRKRIERLVQLGAVRLSAIVDPEAFHYTTAADVFLQVEPAFEAEVTRRLLELQEVSYLALGQGTGEISLEARFKDNEGVRHFLAHTLAAIPHLTIKGYTLVPRILKNLDDWLPKPEDFS